MRFVIFALVASTFFGAGNSCLKAVTVAFAAMGLLTTTENCFNLNFLGILQRSRKNFPLFVTLFVFALLASAIYSASSSVFQALAVKLQTLG